MILRLRHAIACTYERPVASAGYQFRLRPRALGWQRVLSFVLAADPVPSRQRDGVDHFGNPTTRMFHDTPHARLEVAAEATVELVPRPAPTATVPWEQVADAVRNHAWAWREAEFAFPSPLVPPLPDARAFAAPSFPPGRPIAEAASCLARRSAERAGSCQELAHGMIAGLRSFGLPARYMTGYGVARPPGAEQVRAWVGCWLGPGAGWFDLDPGSGGVIGQAHVCLGWGRDAADCRPAGAVVRGSGLQALEVRVELEAAGVPVAE